MKQEDRISALEKTVISLEERLLALYDYLGLRFEAEAFLTGQVQTLEKAKDKIFS
jgi:hypothetical protein